MEYKIIERRMIVPNIHELVVDAPNVARSIQPGQFVILRPNDKGERMPLSISDYDADKGTVTTFFMEVGESTSNLALLKPGSTIPTFVGPLGLPTEIENFGTVVCVGGCYGIGSIYPIVKKLKEAGNTVYVFLEARSKYLIYWNERYEEIADGCFIITRDGTMGHTGHIRLMPDILKAQGITPDRFIVNGCTFLLHLTSSITKPSGIKTIVNMNPIMIDGTGMCGVCRLTVNDEIKFACVDGPDFDGHLVNWDEFKKRRVTYFDEETAPLRKSGTGTAHHCRHL
ncbi:MAG: sulfide/dihydroorotate dehydrogenase-like FAD/NAD-binding protein [bacterium]